MGCKHPAGMPFKPGGEADIRRSVLRQPAYGPTTAERCHAAATRRSPPRGCDSGQAERRSAAPLTAGRAVVTSAGYGA